MYSRQKRLMQENKQCVEGIASNMMSRRDHEMELGGRRLCKGVGVSSQRRREPRGIFNRECHAPERTVESLLWQRDGEPAERERIEAGRPVRRLQNHKSAKALCTKILNTDEDSTILTNTHANPRTTSSMHATSLLFTVLDKGNC